MIDPEWVNLLEVGIACWQLKHAYKGISRNAVHPQMKMVDLM